MKKLSAIIILWMLIIIRSWNPDTGQLVVRLPMHNASLVATQVFAAKDAKPLGVGEVFNVELLQGNFLQIKELKRIFQIQTVRFEESK